MTSKIAFKTTFEPAKTIEPIYTGGEISLDASGRLLATCLEEDVLIIDIQTSKKLAHVEGDGEPVTSIALTPSASHLIVCSRSLSMRIYGLQHVDDVIETNLRKTLRPHTTPVVSTTVDESGHLLATGGADGTVKIWDIRGGYISHTFHGHGSVASALHLFDSGAASSAKPKRKGKRKSMTDDDDEVVEGSGSTMLLAAGTEDGKIRIWNLGTRKSVAVLESHVSVVRSLDFSPTHQTLLSASRDKTVIVWDTQTWKTRTVIPVLETVESAGFVLDGKYCFSGGEQGILRIWNAETCREVTKTQKPGLVETDAIVGIEHSPNEQILLSVHQDQTLRVHSLNTLADVPADKLIEPLPVIRRISGNLDEIIDLACVGPDRSLLALATNTESIRIVEGTANATRFGSDIALLEGHDDIIICLDVDWSGHWLATGAKDNTARLWRLDPASSSYTIAAIFRGHAESLGAIALPRTPPQSNQAAAQDPLNHPPSFLLTGSQDRTVKRWDTAKLSLPSPNTSPSSNTKALYTRVAHEKDINALDVSPTSPFFASASQDRTIKIWSLDDGSVAAILRGHKRGVWSIRFAPASTPPINLADGGTSGSRGLLASASGDRTVKVWSLSTYICLLTFEGHSNSVLKVIWLPPPKLDSDSDSTTQPTRHATLASASSDTLIKLWNPHAPSDTDHLLTTLSTHTDRIWSLSTHPLSPYPLLSADAAGTLIAWTDATASTSRAANLAASARIEQDQSLQNHIRSKNYREVITLALQLNHPGRLLALFTDVIVGNATPEAGSITGSSAVDAVLATLSPSQLYLLLQRVRDWNTNARSAPVAQRVLHALLRMYPSSVWVEMARDRRMGGGMRDLLRALEVYTERHYRRVEELVDEGFLMEYMLGQMDEVTGGSGGGGVVNGHRGMNGDVVIV